jgi:hyperosmotically inducible protein
MLKTLFVRPLLICIVFFFQALILMATTAQAQPQGNQQYSAKAQARITKEVQHQILKLPNFGTFDNIAFRIDGYSVTLFGQVVNPSLKDEAENVVKKIEGVEHVENRIEVLSASPGDDRLRRDLRVAIYQYGPLQHYFVGSNRPVHIIVDHGHVTLEGALDRQSDKDMAGMRANGVAGVFSVQNNIVVPAKGK